MLGQPQLRVTIAFPLWQLSEYDEYDKTNPKSLPHVISASLESIVGYSRPPGNSSHGSVLRSEGQPQSNAASIFPSLHVSESDEDISANPTSLMHVIPDHFEKSAGSSRPPGHI